MAVRGSDEGPARVVEGLRGGDDFLVLRRANQLCVRAEPHADAVPCPAHLHEARRQLLPIAV